MADRHLGDTSRPEEIRRHGWFDDNPESALSESPTLDALPSSIAINATFRWARMEMSSVRLCVSAVEPSWRELRDTGPFPASIGAMNGNERIDLVGEDWLWLVDADWVDDSYVPQRKVTVAVWSGQIEAFRIGRMPDLGVWGPGRHLFGTSNERRASAFFVEGRYLFSAQSEGVPIEATCRALAQVRITSLPVG